MFTPIKISELKNLYTTELARVFPADEIPPYTRLLQCFKEGKHEGFFFIPENEEEPVGYVINSVMHDAVLCYFLAIYDDFQGKGYGSLLIAALAKHYAEYNYIWFEVERVCDAENAKERDIRQRRIVFYERAGLRIAPEIKYTAFGVPMHIMVLPLTQKQVDTAQILDTVLRTYQTILPKILHNRIKAKMAEDCISFTL